MILKKTQEQHSNTDIERPTMTDKHIPASKLLALPRLNRHLTEDDNGGLISYNDLRALIDEAAEVEPIAWIKFFSVEDNNPEGRIEGVDAEVSETFGYIPVFASPPSNADLTKLVGELVEALDRYSGCSGRLSDEINALVTRAKEYLK